MTDEAPAVRLTVLGDPDAGGVCADGVCLLPSVASGPSVVAGPSAEPGTGPAAARPDGDEADRPM